MKSFSSFFLSIALCALPTLQAFAWGQKGHRIIAQIAYDHLSCSAQRQIDRVLGNHGAIYLANWADEIKSDTVYPASHTWHYQDLPAGLSDEQLVASLTHYPTEGGNLFWAIDTLTSALRANKKDTVALTFLVHLVGDVFCPMHMGHLDDLGGNKVKCKWYGQNTNLHSIWDSKIIESQGYSYSEYAQYLVHTYSSQRKSILSMTRADVLRHNYALTTSIYDYHSTWKGNAYHYVYRWRNDMEYQLYMAGVRLAQILDSIY